MTLKNAGNVLEKKRALLIRTKYRILLRQRNNQKVFPQKGSRNCRKSLCYPQKGCDVVTEMWTPRGLCGIQYRRVLRDGTPAPFPCNEAALSKQFLA